MNGQEDVADIVVDVDRLVADSALNISQDGDTRHSVSTPQAECRICQELEDINNLETPCACSGNVKYAHRSCVQRWCNLKGNTICEVCHRQYQNGYTLPPRTPQSDFIRPEVFGRGGIISGRFRPELHHLPNPDPLAMTGRDIAKYNFLALIVMFLLLLAIGFWL